MINVASIFSLFETEREVQLDFGKFEMLSWLLKVNEISTFITAIIFVDNIFTV